MTDPDIPYFLWDYKLSKKEAKNIIERGDSFSRNFLVTRILESARFTDVFKYITLKKLIKIFPNLRLKKDVKDAWQKAFKAWGVNFS